jgi:hypothetical protein
MTRGNYIGTAINRGLPNLRYLKTPSRVDIGFRHFELLVSLFRITSRMKQRRRRRKVDLV